MAVYLGDGKQVVAPHTGTVVQIQPLGKFPVAATRPWATAAAQS
jgi:hypothetical protein